MIAAAYKSLNANTKWKDADDMPRLELEQKCEFLGLIIMQVWSLSSFEVSCQRMT